MPYNPQIHHRKSIRLKGYDYAQAGLYFITICCQNHISYFGHIQNGEMILNDAGKMIETEWLNLKNRFPNIQLHEFVTMPNHFHGILEIVGVPLGDAQNINLQNVDAQNEMVLNEMVLNGKEKGRPQGHAPTVGDMMDAFKSITTVEYIRGVKQNDWAPFNRKLWQRNYWEHIIRDENSHQKISDYIINNPQNWEKDKLKL